MQDEPVPLRVLLGDWWRAAIQANDERVLWACHWQPDPQAEGWYRHTWSASYGEPGDAEHYAREYARGLVKQGLAAHVDRSDDGGVTWRPSPSAWELPVVPPGC